MKNTNQDHTLAAAITKAASQQTYQTIRLLADPERRADAFRAYAYFRWVDDTLDAREGGGFQRHAFVERQEWLLEQCYQGASPRKVGAEEQMLVGLVRNDLEKDSGLQSYLRNMMAVMVFDVERRGKLVSQAELNEYTRWLAVAVTEAMHYFIGNGCYTPQNEARYMAVTAAHITHMLRDTFDDIQAGYFNIAREAVDAGQILPSEVLSDPYRNWVRSRVDLARLYFQRGKAYLNQVENPRCRLAGRAYTARFEWLLDTIEKEDYRLRPQYDERKSVGTGLRMSWLALAPMINPGQTCLAPQAIQIDQSSLR